MNKEPQCINYLPPRESQILELIADGKTNREIGVALNITTNSVKNCLGRTYIRLGVKSRSHAVAVAIMGGLIKNEK